MSTASELFGVIKRIMLVSEDLTRISTEVKELSSDVAQHEGRLIRIETALAIAGRQNQITLSGN